MVLVTVDIIDAELLAVMSPAEAYEAYGLEGLTALSDLIEVLRAERTTKPEPEAECL